MPQGSPKPRHPRRLTRLRLRSAPVLLALLSALVFLATFTMREVTYWQGFLLAIPFLVATTGLGWQAGALLAPFGLALVFLRSSISGIAAGPLDYVGMALAMALGATAGHQIFALWRSAERRARHSERRAKLLQEAAVELNQCTTVDALFRNAPRLLSDLLPFTHAEIFVPEDDQLRVHTSYRWRIDADFAIPLRTVTGRAYTTAEAQYVPDARLDPDYMVAPGASPTLSELALPIVTSNEVRAVLNLEHDQQDAFGADVQESLDAFVRMVEEVLHRLETTEELARNKAEQKVLADLGQRMLVADGVADAAGGALEILLPALDVDCGAFLTLSHDQFRSLAARGVLTEARERALQAGLPNEGALARAWRTREPLFMDAIDVPVWSGAMDARSVAVVPVADASRQVQALMALTRVGEARPWTDAQRSTLRSVTTSLSAALDRATLNKQLIAMLAVIRQLSSSEAPTVLYSRAAEATADLVPGAEAASILVRQGDLFYYEAAVGWDLEELQTHAGPFTYDEQLKWYAGDELAFRDGAARVLKGAAITRHSMASERSPEVLGGGRLAQMKSQVMVPIADGEGQIVAVLNLDNFSTEDAFSQNSVRLAESFAQHIAVLVRQAEQVMELERSAVTDQLTGLGNREGFERAVRQELARARRYEHHLNLVMVDLNNFKQVNDRFGHAAGDAALRDVADALRATKRDTDSVFRWGGDEFVVLLPEVRPEAAATAMQRLQETVSSIDVQGLKLGASVGMASYPTDGLDAESLLHRADGRMYERKAAGLDKRRTEVRKQSRLLKNPHS